MTHIFIIKRLNTQIIDVSAKQPDFGVMTIQNASWNGAFAVGEVKGEDKKNDTYLCLTDLLRVGMMAIDSININYFSGVIGVHVVGLQVTFYIITLFSKSLYIMLEICSVRMPRDITQLREYVSAMEDLLLVSSFYKNCTIVSGVELRNLKENIDTDLIRTPEFKTILAQKRDRTRQSPIVYKY